MIEDRLSKSQANYYLDKHYQNLIIILMNTFEGLKYEAS